MFFFILTFFCSLLSSGYLQETNNGDYNLMQHDTDQIVRENWPLQTIHTIQGNFYGQAQRNVIPKPCSRRSNSEIEPLQQKRIPTFTSKVVKPIINYDSTNLKPQALRNEDHNLKTTSDQEYFLNPPLNNDSSNLYKTRNSLSVTKPSIDSFEESNHELISSNNEAIRVNNDEPTNGFPSDPNSVFPLTPGSIFHSVPNSFFSPATSNVLSVAPANEYISGSTNAVDSEINNKFRLAPNSEALSDSSNEISFAPTSKFSYEPNILWTEPLDKFNSEPLELDQSETSVETSTLHIKCSHNKETSNSVGNSRRAMSNNNDDQIDTVRVTLSNDKELSQNNNDPYQVSRVDNENAMASVLTAEPYYNIEKSVKVQNVNNLDKPKYLAYEKSVTRVGKPQFNEARHEMVEPTRGSGISNMGKSGLVLMQTERICYACSTANNPTCWAPDRRTTVKYCRKGNNACMTKTFGSGSTFTLIRDCGRSCDDSEMGGLMPRYKSCSMCHSELCNGAYSISGHSITFALFLIALIKYLN